ncbi:methyltransferase domain-containing protein [bacterium]|nr:methyltransferase domain-containing protein [bacterium]
MKYLFVLGKNHNLSLAEILAIFKDKKIEIINKSIITLETGEIHPEKLIKNLGGIIKIGVVKKELKKDTEEIKKNILDLIKIKANNLEGKTKFGLSQYGKIDLNIKKIGMEIKKNLKEIGINSRLVTSREKSLSSVVVETNKLTKGGVEIILCGDQDKIIIGQTSCVQDFRSLSFRDYGRPARDDYSGMIPPKLAQIMLNLCSLNEEKNSLILDPFCGSGTILTEAMLMDYKNIVGSDISERAIKNSEKNINWIKEKYSLKNINHNLYKHSSKKLTEIIKQSSVDGIVTEPYLGPQRGEINFKKIIKELENLYSNSLKEFEKILKPDKRIVMVWPVFEKGETFINPNLNKLKIINPLQNKNNFQGFITSKRNTIIYSRDNQRVYREIIILKKEKS